MEARPGYRTLEQLVAQLRELGVLDGELLMIHASLRAVGPVAGGADGLIDALEAAVGPGGTLLMNVGARDDHAWVNDRPAAERAALLRDAEPFDYLSTSADPDNGVLAEVFRTRRGTAVGDHPEGRFGGRGRLANAIVEDVPWDDYYGPGSPLERFVRAGGRVLRLGADLDTMTVLHYAEYLADLPWKRRVRQYRLLGRPPEVRSFESLDDAHGIVDYPGEDYFALILRAYLDTGRGASGLVGNAPSELIDATDFVVFGVEWMTRNLAAR